MMSRFVPLFMVLILLFPVIGDATEIDETVSIETGSFHVISFDMSMLDSLKISFSTHGAPVDILLMNESFFDIYSFSIEHGIQSLIYYYPEHSFLNSTNGEMSFRALIPGKYFVVIDNTDLNSKGGFNGGIVEVSFRYDHWINPISFLNALLIVATLVVLVVAGIALSYRNRKMKRMIRSRPLPGVVIKRTVVRRSVPCAG